MEAGMINGRYEIVRKLGEGGSGEVYLAHDKTADSNIAIKILNSTRSVDEVNIRKEFEILRRFEHPNLMRVFEFGKVSESSDTLQLLDRYYYTMEYLDGCDAMQYFQAMPHDATKVRLLEETLVQVLVTLDSIHRCDIIHYDIKPQNIFILRPTKLHEGSLPSIHVKLTDFGFSITTSRSAEFPSLRGTVEYIAPELLQGKSPDRRLDLYSLGATFYYLWENRFPHRGETPIEVMKNALTTAFPRFEDRNNIVSPLPEIVATLCQKNPDERYQSARDVLMQFASSGLEERIKEYLVQASCGIFVGREREKEIVQKEIRHFKESAEAHRKVILVEASSGGGKTAFLREIAKNAIVDGLLIVHISAGSHDDPPLTDCLRRLHDPSHLRPLLILADGWTTLHQEVRREITELLASAWQNGEKIMLVLAESDDRDCELPFPPDEPVTTVLLNELSQADIGVLFDFAFGQEIVPTGYVEKFFAVYGGNPRIVHEAIRLLIHALPLSTLKERSSFMDMNAEFERSFADTLVGLFVARIKNLRRDKCILLEILSCFDCAPERNLLKVVVPFHEDRLEEFLCSLTRSGFVRSSEDETRYSLRHLSLKNNLYSSLSEAERRSLHQLIAQRWCESSENPTGEDLHELGRQCERGGSVEKAGAYYEVSGDRAFGEKKYVDACERYADALRCQGNDTAKIFHLRVMLARGYAASGGDTDSARIYKEILGNLPEDDSKKMGIAKELGKVLVRLGENLEAIRILEDALRLSMDTANRFEISEELISLKITEGSLDEAIMMGKVQKELAQSFPDRQQLALVETDIGIAQFYKGSFQDSIESFNRAFHIYRDYGYEEKMVTALNNIGNVFSAMGEARSALDSWNRALRLTMESPMKHERGLLHNNIGIAHYKLQEYSEARSNYDEAQRIFSELKAKNGLAFSLTNYGEVEYAEGLYECAHTRWVQALEMYREMQDALGVGQTLLELAHVNTTIGRFSVVRDYLEEAHQAIAAQQLLSLVPLYHYLKGQLYASLEYYHEALQAFRQSEKQYQANDRAFTGGIETVSEKLVEISFRKAEADLASHKFDESLNILNADNDTAQTLSRRLAAELYYILGRIARERLKRGKLNGIVDKPIMYFRHSLDLLEEEHVTELTWKVSYALGQEYEQRGNSEKAREHYKAAHVVIEYFRSKFSSEELGTMYLKSDKRIEVAHTLEAGIPKLSEGIIKP